jgi:hypothetical protein
MSEERILIRLLEQSLAQVHRGVVRDLPNLRGELGDLLEWAEDLVRSIENRHGSFP